MIKVRINGVVIDLPTLKGVNGKSAYQYAVEAGFEGTEQEFINLLIQSIANNKTYVVTGTWNSTATTNQSEDYYKFTASVTYTELLNAINAGKIPLILLTSPINQYLYLYNMTSTDSYIKFKGNFEFGSVENTVEVIIYDPNGYLSDHDDAIIFYNTTDDELSTTSRKPLTNSTITKKFTEIEEALGSYIKDVATLIGGDA